MAYSLDDLVSLGTVIFNPDGKTHLVVTPSGEFVDVVTAQDAQKVLQEIANYLKEHCCSEEILAGVLAWTRQKTTPEFLNSYDKAAALVTDLWHN